MCWGTSSVPFPEPLWPTQWLKLWQASLPLLMPDQCHRICMQLLNYLNISWGHQVCGIYHTPLLRQPASVDQTMDCVPAPLANASLLLIQSYMNTLRAASLVDFIVFLFAALLIPRHELLLYVSKASTSLSVFPPTYPPDHWNLDPLGSFANSVQLSHGAVNSIRSTCFDKADEGIASRSQRGCHGTWAASTSRLIAPGLTTETSKLAADLRQRWCFVGRGHTSCWPWLWRCL